jgi:ABC-type multidrug transport system permease subunit
MHVTTINSKVSFHQIYFSIFAPLRLYHWSEEQTNPITFLTPARLAMSTDTDFHLNSLEFAHWHA